jgi:hypothetical protein
MRNNENDCPVTCPTGNRLIMMMLAVLSKKFQKDGFVFVATPSTPSLTSLQLYVVESEQRSCAVA